MNLTWTPAKGVHRLDKTRKLFVIKLVVGDIKIEFAAKRNVCKQSLRLFGRRRRSYHRGNLTPLLGDIVISAYDIAAAAAAHRGQVNFATTDQSVRVTLRAPVYRVNRKRADLCKRFGVCITVQRYHTQEKATMSASQKTTEHMAKLITDPFFPHIRPQK